MSAAPAGIATLLVLLAAAALTFARAGGRGQRALALLAFLGGYFALFATLVPAAAERDGLGIVLLFGSAAVFKLMNRFESDR